MSPRAKRGAAGAPPSFSATFYRHFPNAPEPGKADEETGKFVILSRGKSLHLVLSPLAFTPYHANIVHQYLQVEGRGKVESATASGCRILSPEWAVHGGGHYVVQHWLRNLVLHGKSSAFGPFEWKRIAAYEEQIPEKLGLEGFTLEIR